MAAAVRFTKAERAFIITSLTKSLGIELTKSETRLRDNIVTKLETSELVKGTGSTPGIGWQRAANAMREVLGSGLALPPSPNAGWMARMSARIRDLGLSETDCRAIAKVWVAKGWRPPFSFEKMILGADRFLAEAQLPLAAPQNKLPGWSGPTEVDDT